MIEEVANKTFVFPSRYFLLRKKEGRIYSDNEVARLPQIQETHQFYQEWLVRKSSSDKLIRYLQAKRLPLEILEVGCGNGWLSAKLSEIPSAKVIGIDINIEELTQAKRVFHQKGNLEFFNRTLQSEMMNDKKFDVIVFASSIQYFSSLRQLLNNALNKLKPNGEIHILDSNFYLEREIDGARQRSKHYFLSIGFPEMSDQYFHHSLDEIRQFQYKIMYEPHLILNKLRRNKNPFYWICVRANA